MAIVDKILRSAKPADLQIEQPTKFEVGINLGKAKALAVEIPRNLADSVPSDPRLTGVARLLTWPQYV